VAVGRADHAFESMPATGAPGPSSEAREREALLQALSKRILRLLAARGMTKLGAGTAASLGPETARCSCYRRAVTCPRRQRERSPSARALVVKLFVQEEQRRPSGDHDCSNRIRDWRNHWRALVVSNPKGATLQALRRDCSELPKPRALVQVPAGGIPPGCACDSIVVLTVPPGSLTGRRSLARSTPAN